VHHFFAAFASFVDGSYFRVVDATAAISPATRFSVQAREP
jgi:hypothetical protein